MPDSLRIRATTAGSPSRSYRDQGTTWRWNGKPASWPYDPATHDNPVVQPVAGGGNAVRTEARQERIQAFAAALEVALAAGLPRPKAVQEAGRQIHVQDKTARSYARALKDAEVAP